MRKNWIFIFGFLLATITQVAAQSTISEDWIVGTWVPSSGKARIKIEKIGTKYYGKTVWLQTPNDANGNPKTDVQNPDESLRNAPRLGLRIMKDFVYEGDGVFKDGTVYDPEKGKTYCGKITITDQNTLSMRGYLCNASLLGRTDTWTRYTE